MCTARALNLVADGLGTTYVLGVYVAVTLRHQCITNTHSFI